MKAKPLCSIFDNLNIETMEVFKPITFPYMPDRSKTEEIECE